MSIPKIRELIEQSIEERKQLQSEMVGQLYPRIIQAEIDQLLAARAALLL